MKAILAMNRKKQPQQSFGTLEFSLGKKEREKTKKIDVDKNKYDSTY